MAEVLDVRYNKDNGYTRITVLDPYTGACVGSPIGLAYDFNGPEADPGPYTHRLGDPVDEVIIYLNGQNQFELAGQLSAVHFDDGTDWTPGAK